MGRHFWLPSITRKSIVEKDAALSNEVKWSPALMQWHKVCKEGSFLSHSFLNSNSTRLYIPYSLSYLVGYGQTVNDDWSIFHLMCPRGVLPCFRCARWPLPSKALTVAGVLAPALMYLSCQCSAHSFAACFLSSESCAAACCHCWQHFKK